MAPVPKIPVPVLSDAEVAFPADVLSWIPPRDEIPEEFRFQRARNEWAELAHQWFYKGLPNEVEFHPQPGVDPEQAVRAIQAVLGSFQLKHEHKEEAVAYLFSLWFVKVKNWRRK